MSEETNRRKKGAPGAATPLKSTLLSLEQRLMFDAAAAATTAEVASEQIAQEQANAAVSPDADTTRTDAALTESEDLFQALTTFLPADSPTEIVFVDPTVPDYQALLAGMDPAIEVVVLDGGQDGIEQIAGALSGRTGIDAIHLISHGEAGELHLGTGVLTAESMSSTYADTLATIRQALSENADILVYGCDFSKGDTGQRAVERLADLTGADVQASNDSTGHSSLGGDWDLEVRAGSIETQVAIADQAQLDWIGVLAETWMNAGTGAVIAGPAGNDWYVGDSANNTPSAAGGGADIMYGAEGDDTLQGGSGNDILVGGTGNDTISGNSDDDVILGGAGNDYLDGGSSVGKNTIIGGGGNDQMIGGSGADVFRFTGAQSGDAYTVDGGGGTDIIDLSEFSTATITNSGGVITVDRGSGNVFTITHSNVESIITAATVGNHGPLADAGVDQTVAMSATVTLTAAGSSDRDGNSLTYQWTQIEGPKVTLSSSTAASPTFTAPGSATTLQFVVVVSDGTTSHADTVTISVGVVNSAPTVSNLSGDTLNYTEDSGAVVIDQGANALVTDSDSANFDTGTLTISISVGVEPTEDVLGIRNQGSGAGQIGVSGSKVTYGGVTIGTFIGGAGGNNLVITFNSNATPTAVTALVKNITYENINTDSPIEGSCTIRFALTDGDGGTSANYDVSAWITGVNDAPLNSVPGSQSTNEDTNLIFSSGNGNQISITDPDNSGASFEATISVTNGTLTLAGTTGVTFVTGDGTADTTMTIRGTVANINAALNGLSYSPTADSNGGATLTIGTLDSSLVSLNIDTNLQARYTFEGNANDVAPGTAQDGTLVNGATITTNGTRGQVLNLDGVNDYVELSAHRTSFETLAQGTIAMWIRTTDTSAELFSLSDTADVSSLAALWITSSGKISFDVWENNVNLLQVNSVTSVNDGQWHHVAVTVGAGGNQLYIDGVQASVTYVAGSSASTTFFSSVSGIDVVQLGRNSNSSGGGLYYTGLIDDTRIYTQALSAADITTLANDLNLTDTDTVSITVNAVNDAPTVTNLTGDSLAYVEGDGALVIEQGGNVSVTDVDSTNFDTGTLTVSFTAGSDSAEDVLGIRHQGTGAGQIGVSGSNITYGGTVIGTYAGGSGGTNLVITLNSNATPTAVTALAQSITYENTDTSAPTTGARTVRYVLTDGDGGTSSNYDTTVTVSGVNDAPYMPGVMLDSGTEDTTKTFQVSWLTGFSSDVDAGAQRGLAIVGVDNSNGTWQYTLNGTDWIDIGAVSTSNALLLAADATSAFRFVPNPDWNGATGLFTYKAWDQTSGTAGTYADASISGGTTAFSGTSGSSLFVTAVNDAPVLADTALTLTVAEDAGVPSGVVGSTISAFTGGITEPDGSSTKGIAITGTNETNGTWYYTTNGGTTWTAVNAGTAVSGTNSLLLADNASTRLYFAPNADYNGTSSGALTLRAWDQTSGTAGTKVTTASNGGTTAFSSATDTIDVSVTAVNDAPVVTPIAPDVTFVEGGMAQLIDATGTVTDVDSSNFDGGVMTISISANGTADDRLVVGNWGTGSGQVGVSGSDVTYGGTVIGTVSGGTSGSDPLIITFNLSATPTAVQEVYRSIQFENVSDNPSTATRTLSIGLTDGDGGTATPQTKLVYVQATNDAPVMTFGEGDKNFTEGALAVMIDALPNVSDLDSTNFDTGTLTITISANPSVDDRVELLNTGMGAGQIGVSGTNVYYGGTLIGTQAGGIGAVPFVVTFNANADAAIVGEVMANIRFWVAGDAPSTATRTVEAVLTDGDGGTSLTASKQITVTAVNDPTIITGGTSGTGNEDTTVTGTLTATDAEGLADGTVFTVSTTATNGTASIDPATGLWSYSPNADWNGSDSFTVTITDDAGNTSQQVISLTVTPVADITGDSLTTTEDNAISANVLTGTNGATADSFEGTPVLTSVTQGANGTVTFLSNGTVTYTPTANFTGSDSFTYTITSGGVTETATVNVTVTAVDDATVVTGGTSGTGNEDTTVTGTLTATDAEGLADGTVFTVSTTATNGTASIDPATGLWSYSPNADWNGSDSFTVTITDDAGNTSQQVISLTVTPVADITGDSLTTTEDNAISANVLTGTNGATADSFEGTPVLTSVTQGANGTVTFLSNGTVTYTPTANFTGSDSFTYTITSGGVTETATVNVTVTAVDDATVVTGGTSGTGNEDTTVTGTLTATDAEGLADGTVFTVSTTATNGTASIDPATGLWSYSPNADWNGSDSFTVTITDDAGNTSQQVISLTVTPVADITGDSLTTTEDNAISANVLTGTNGATADSFEGTPVLTSVTQGANGTVTFLSNGTVTYTPTANFTGSDSFTYTITSGGVTETATVNVTVTAVDDATVVTGGTSGTGNEDTTVTGTLTATDAEGLADGTVFTVSTTATNGTASIDPATGLWSYSPNADWNGSDSFTVTITDDAGNTSQQVISLTVTPVADITGDSLTTTEDNAISANVLTGTNGATADSFEGTPVLTSVTQGANGTVTFLSNGTVTYTPTANFTGSDSFTYTITSGGVTETATVNVTVTAVDDATVVTGGTSGTGNEDTTVTGTLTATDAEGLADGTVFTVSTTATNGTASIDPATGLWSYSPNADWNGSDSFTVTITDDAGNTSQQVISLTVTPVADITGDSLTTTEDNAISANVLTGTNGATADSFEGTPVLTSVTQGANGTVTFLSNGTVTYTPTANFTGSDSFTYTITSGGVTETATVNVTVTAVDDATVVTGGTSGTGNEDTTVTGTLTATDAEGLADGTVFTVSTTATNGTASIDPATGLWSYSPNADWNGSDSFTVTITDDAGNTSQQVISLTVTPVADITGDSLTTTEDNAISANVLTGTNGATADSFEGTPVLTSVTQGANGTVTFLSNGTVTYTPTANFTGSDSFTYTITSGGVTETATVNVTVTAVDDATVVTGGTSGTGNEDTTVTGTLTATDAEGLADGTVFTVSTTATNGTASIDPATGLWSYSPNADWNGSDSFTVTITDDAGNTSQQVISLTVTPVADITGDSLTTTEDNAISANVLTGTNGATADSFEGTPVLTSVTQGANGTVTFLSNGTVTYTPTANFTGSDSFTYTITSGGVTETATVNVTVTAVDDATVVTGGTSGTGNEDTTVTGTLTATDAEGLADGTVFTVSTTATNGTASIDPATGLWSYSPNADWNGSDSFTVTITDDAGNTSQQVISLTVTPVNDVPLLVTNTGSAVAEGATDTIDSSELAVTDVDHAAAQLTYSIGTGPAYGRLELTTAPGVSVSTFTQADIAANRLIYVHEGSETTSDSIIFTVSDGAGGSIGSTTVTLTVTPVNDAPTITSDGGGATAAVNVAEHISAVTIVGGADVDLPAQALSYSISGGVDQALFTIDVATGVLSFVAPPDFEVPIDANGDNVYVVQVRVTDTQGASMTQTLQVTVTDVPESRVPLPPSLVPTTPPAGTPAPPPVSAPVPPTASGPVSESRVGPLSTTPVPSRGFVAQAAQGSTHREVFRPDDLRRVSDSVAHEEIQERASDQPPASSPLTLLIEASRLDGPDERPSPAELSELLFAKLDEVIERLEEAVASETEDQVQVTRIAAASGVTLSVGFVVWALRSTALLASLFATVPAWQMMDPLPVVATHRKERRLRKRVQEKVARDEQVQYRGLRDLLDKKGEQARRLPET